MEGRKQRHGRTKRRKEGKKKRKWKGGNQKGKTARNEEQKEREENRKERHARKEEKKGSFIVRLKLDAVGGAKQHHHTKHKLPSYQSSSSVG
jgi:hypothetical protein